MARSETVPLEGLSESVSLELKSKDGATLKSKENIPSTSTGKSVALAVCVCAGGWVGGWVGVCV